MSAALSHAEFNAIFDFDLAQAGEVKWVYKDDQGAQQGPFTVAEINGWFTAGYLQADRMVRRDGDEGGEFVPLSSVPELAAPAAAPAMDPYLLRSTFLWSRDVVLVLESCTVVLIRPLVARRRYAMMQQQQQQQPAAMDPSQITIPEGKLLGEVKNWNDEKGFGFLIPTGVLCSLCLSLDWKLPAARI